MIYLREYSDLLAWLLIAYIVGFFLLFWATFILYAAVIKFREVRDGGYLNSLTPSAPLMMKIALYIGLLCDWALDWIYLTVIFFELPHEFLCTFRVKRHYWELSSGWRQRKAEWFARNFLLPIDPHHMDK